MRVNRPDRSIRYGIGAINARYVNRVCSHRDRTERLQQMLVELAAHGFHDRKRPGVRERQPVGALFDQRRVDVDDRRQSHDIADLIAAQAIGISGAVENLVMMQHHIKHFRRKSALRRERIIPETRMHPHLPHILVGELSGLVENGNWNERLADIVQKGSADHTALIVLVHTEMLPEGDGKSGDKQAVTITTGVMPANGGQPFAQ